jgi:hypothetical protein
MIDFTTIDKNLPNGDNMGGISQLIYYGLYADVETFPTQPVSPTTLAEAATLTGDLVMKSGKRLWEMYLTDDTGEYKMELVGEVDGHSYVNHLSLFHPGLQDKILGFMRAAKNENLVFIVVDSDGQKYVMGDALRPAVLAGSPDGAGTGKATAARKGISMEFTYKTNNQFVYKGNIPLTEASA